ncbi:MAG: hypothetical protein EXS10_02145 [Phycisphaerales bacterium]|nr:hypothetical protein [Phycisphaerales bacterium]
MLGLKSEGGAGTMHAVGASTLALPLEFPHVVYSLTDASESYWMSDVPLDALTSGKVQQGVVSHVQLLWRPYPGKTPTGSSALNLAVRVLVISNGEMGLYSGGGFGDPAGDAGDDLVELVVMGSSLTLVAKTQGFTDLLSPCALIVDVAARLSPEDAVRYRRGAAQLLTNTLEQPRWVRQENGSDPPTRIASADELAILAEMFTQDSSAASMQ